MQLSGAWHVGTGGNTQQTVFINTYRLCMIFGKAGEKVTKLREKVTKVTKVTKRATWLECHMTVRNFSMIFFYAPPLKGTKVAKGSEFWGSLEPLRAGSGLATFKGGWPVLALEGCPSKSHP